MLKRNSFKRHFFVPFIALMLVYGMSLCSQEAPSGIDLRSAIRAVDLEKVKHIVHTRTNLLYSLNASNLTPLHLAIKVNNLPIVRFLLESGADVNAVTICSDSSLHIAAKENVCKDIVELLLACGANVNARNHLDATALDKAMQYGSIDAAEALLEYGVDCEGQQDLMVWTPLHFAAFGNAASAIEFLVCCGLLIDEVDSSGCTPLLLALKGSRVKAASFLLEFGVPLELDREMRALNQRGNTWNRLRKVIQDRRQEVETVLLDNQLPFFSALAPVVIRIIIDCMVTPRLPVMQEIVCETA